MKFNQIVKFIHLLRVFKSIQLLIKVVWERLFGVAFICLLIKGAKLKVRNYFTKKLNEGSFVRSKGKAKLGYLYILKRIV